MNSLEITYKLIKQLISLRDELTSWARISREKKFSQIHQQQMTKKALEIDELLREVGTEWVDDYEENNKIRQIINKSI